MDLSFARKFRQTKAVRKDEPELASLLATLAARQALSPTARAQSDTVRDEAGAVLPCKVHVFAPQRGLKAPAPAGSFNEAAASALVTGEKDK
jgi:hypothetical protein